MYCVSTADVDPSWGAELLEKKSLDALPCRMAPPWGLYLAEVHYDWARQAGLSSQRLEGESDDEERDDEGD